MSISTTALPTDEQAIHLSDVLEHDPDFKALMAEGQTILAGGPNQFASLSAEERRAKAEQFNPATAMRNAIDRADVSDKQKLALMDEALHKLADDMAGGIKELVHAAAVSAEAEHIRSAVTIAALLEKLGGHAELTQFDVERAKDKINRLSSEPDPIRNVFVYSFRPATNGEDVIN